MQPHEQRVLDEHHDLAGKMSKLSDFLETFTFKVLPAADRVLLETQYYQMSGYLETLQRRVERF